MKNGARWACQIVRASCWTIMDSFKLINLLVSLHHSFIWTRSLLCSSWYLWEWQGKNLLKALNNTSSFCLVCSSNTRQSQLKWVANKSSNSAPSLLLSLRLIESRYILTVTPLCCRALCISLIELRGPIWTVGVQTSRFQIRASSIWRKAIKLAEEQAVKDTISINQQNGNIFDVIKQGHSNRQSIERKAFKPISHVEQIGKMSQNARKWCPPKGEQKENAHPKVKSKTIHTKLHLQWIWVVLTHRKVPHSNNTGYWHPVLQALLSLSVAFLLHHHFHEGQSKESYPKQHGKWKIQPNDWQNCHLSSRAHWKWMHQSPTNKDTTSPIGISIQLVSTCPRSRRQPIHSPNFVICKNYRYWEKVIWTSNAKTNFRVAYNQNSMQSRTNPKQWLTNELSCHGAQYWSNMVFFPCW